ncbi:MAG: hypothetical protein RLZZ303_266 [Candidatus Hydrogenedentota bacterium]|jgi:hypothetical protein
MNPNASVSRAAATPRALRRTLIVAAFLGLGALPVACSTPETDTGVGAVQFQDMVVPLGFTLLDDNHQSHSREAGEWRMGKFQYQGSAAIADAANYVRQRMPQHSWSIEADEVQATGGKLRFVRGRYVAEYTFARVEGSTMMYVDYQTDYSRR